MPVLILLTKVDQYDVELTTNLSKTFHSTLIYSLIQVSPPVYK